MILNPDGSREVISPLACICAVLIEQHFPWRQFTKGNMGISKILNWLEDFYSPEEAHFSSEKGWTDEKPGCRSYGDFRPSY